MAGELNEEIIKNAIGEFICVKVILKVSACEENDECIAIYLSEYFLIETRGSLMRTGKGDSILLLFLKHELFASQ